MVRKTRMMVIMILAVLTASVAWAGLDITHPLKCEETESQARRIMDYIEAVTKSECMHRGCTPTTLKLAQEQEIAAFRRLRKAKRPKAVDAAMVDACNSGGFCNYRNIERWYLLYKHDPRFK